MAIDFTEANKDSWREYLAEFRRDVFPIFEEYGFTFSEAFLLWCQNRLYNAIDRLVEQGEDGEDWRQE